MHISYDTEDLRKVCYLLQKHVVFSIFNPSEIRLIRSCINDLRAADNLSEVPLPYNIISEKKLIEISISNIYILAICITDLQKVTSKQIKRVKILEILNNDIQISRKLNKNDK